MRFCSGSVRIRVFGLSFGFTEFLDCLFSFGVAVGFISVRQLVLPQSAELSLKRFPIGDTRPFEVICTLTAAVGSFWDFIDINFKYLFGGVLTGNLGQKTSTEQTTDGRNSENLANLR